MTTPVAFKKATIPWAVRRAVALAAGAVPGESSPVHCHYCGAEGWATWQRHYSGKVGGWVHFTLELDHVIPEFRGGPTTAENIVLACRPCNRSKGHH